VDGQTIVAIVAAVIALAAMSVAIWQATEARWARKAASDQAETAKTALAETQKQTLLAREANTKAGLALSATEKAANAAEEQVVEARRAFKVAEERYKQAGAHLQRSAVAALYTPAISWARAAKSYLQFCNEASVDQEFQAAKMSAADKLNVADVGFRQAVNYCAATIDEPQLLELVKAMRDSYESFGERFGRAQIRLGIVASLSEVARFRELATNLRDITEAV
jgi:hypothetical protein